MLRLIELAILAQRFYYFTNQGFLSQKPYEFNVLFFEVRSFMSQIVLSLVFKHRRVKD